MTKPTVFLAMPHYSSQIHLASAKAFFADASCGACDIVARRTCGGSLLAKSFNMLWAESLTANESDGVRYFVMLHADIGPEPNWVDSLVHLMEKHDADVISAVSPMKSVEGLTSTAIDNPEDEFDPLYRLTIRDLGNLPSTFSASDVGHPAECLLINTGCMIVDMDKDWCHKRIDGRLISTFSIDDAIRSVDGKYQVSVASEDWQFSRLVHREGGKLMATSEIQLTHYGEIGFRNYGSWGTCTTDPRRIKNEVMA